LLAAGLTLTVMMRGVDLGGKAGGRRNAKQKTPAIRDAEAGGLSLNPTDDERRDQDKLMAGA